MDDLLLVYAELLLEEAQKFAAAATPLVRKEHVREFAQHLKDFVERVPKADKA